MKAMVIGFGTAKENAEYKVVYLNVHKVDPLTGVEVSIPRTMLCARPFHFKTVMCKVCEITTLPSPKLGKEVVVDIKEIK